MRNRAAAWVWAAAGGTALGAGLFGCDQTCYDTFTCPPAAATAGETTNVPVELGSGPLCVADPALGPVGKGCGIWVRDSLPGDDNHPGTQEAPVHTLAKAIELAEAGPKYVFACGETFHEAISLPAGVSLFGGFDCENHWRYAGTGKRATIVSQPGAITLTYLDANEDDFSVVGEVIVRSADAKKPGGSSIAVFFREHSKGTMRRSDVIAGNGADGADGEPGDYKGMPAQQGLPGNDGSNACTGSPGLGGASVVLQCDDGTVSTSGYAGNGGPMAATSGADGEPTPIPNQSGYGLGGSGEDAAKGAACEGGTNGAQGVDGLDGLGALGLGRITADGEVIGVPGKDGKPGTPGQGGGGGGGSLGKGLCGNAPPGGAGGGSGGTGGCGGRGGKGGQAGGSSIGVAARAPGIVLHSVTITTANGGMGGKGGALQLGGQAGLPGLGGLGMVNGINGGCGGGVGGQGGKGGNGGGGHGGYSLPIAFTSTDSPPNDLDGPVAFGAAGKGGFGGNPLFFAGIGESGMVAASGPFEK